MVFKYEREQFVDVGTTRSRDSSIWSQNQATLVWSALCCDWEDLFIKTKKNQHGK